MRTFKPMQNKLYKNIALLSLVVMILGVGAKVTMARISNPPAAASGAATIANGGTNATSQTTNGVNYFDGTRITSGTGLTFTGTAAGVASTTPFATLSVEGITSQTNTALLMDIASSSNKQLLTTTAGGQTSSCETVYGNTANGADFASSTSMTINFAQTCNQILLQIGTSATTVTVTGARVGDTKRIIIVNPNAAAGAITWSGVFWFGGTTPTQTTTANGGDEYSCNVTQATSTVATSFKAECGATAALQ